MTDGGKWESTSAPAAVNATFAFEKFSASGLRVSEHHGLSHNDLPCPIRRRYSSCYMESPCDAFDPVISFKKTDDRELPLAGADRPHVSLSSGKNSVVPRKQVFGGARIRFHWAFRTMFQLRKKGQCRKVFGLATLLLTDSKLR